MTDPTREQDGDAKFPEWWFQSKFNAHSLIEHYIIDAGETAVADYQSDIDWGIMTKCCEMCQLVVRAAVDNATTNLEAENRRLREERDAFWYSLSGDHSEPESEREHILEAYRREVVRPRAALEGSHG
jgi:hypothetical protein